MKLFYGTVFPEILINEEEQQHILKVLRMKEGDEIFVTDGKGNLARGTIQLEGKKVKLLPSEIQENVSDFSPRLHIAIAPTKNIDRTEFFVEKATELGIAEITFLLTDNSERKIINIEKIQKKVIAASKQSLRVHFPTVNPLTKLKDFLEKTTLPSTFVAHCDAHFERFPIQTINHPQEITVLIGPEGDFSPAEIELLAEKGIKAVSLGSQRLRTETAGLYVASWNYEKMK